MIKHITMAHDGSDLADAAVPFTAVLARELGCEVTVLRVADAGIHEDLAQRTAMQASLSVLQDALTQGGVASVQVALRVGEAGPTIVDEVRGGRSDLLVMTSHSRAGLARSVLGSVADYVIHHVRDVPVVLCRAGVVLPTITRMLVPLDGLERGAAAVALAQELALRTSAKVTLIRAIDSVGQILAAATPAGYELEAAISVAGAEQIAAAQRSGATSELNSTAAALREAGVEGVTTEVCEGLPVEVIQDAATRLGAELIVAATRGRGGLGRAVLGSVADQIARNANVAVALVRPSD